MCYETNKLVLRRKVREWLSDEGYALDDSGREPDDCSIVEVEGDAGFGLEVEWDGKSLVYLSGYILWYPYWSGTEMQLTPGGREIWCLDLDISLPPHGFEMYIGYDRFDSLILIGSICAEKVTCDSVLAFLETLKTLNASNRSRLLLPTRLRRPLFAARLGPGARVTQRSSRM